MGSLVESKGWGHSNWSIELPRRGKRVGIVDALGL